MNADGPSAEPDEPSGPPHKAGRTSLGDDLIMALRFFSRLPTGPSPHETPDLNRMAMALPLASVVIGLGPVLLLIGGALVGLPGYFAAALAVGAMAIVSGAMAEDALADAADGLFGGQTAERRLEIMKDSRHGTYGVVGLCLFIVLRVVALGTTVAINPLAAAALWLGASIFGRSGSLWLAAALPAARTHGASAAAGALFFKTFAVGMIFAVILLFVLAAPATSIVGVSVVLVVAAVVVTGWTALCRRLVGGQTGDLIGALGALIEIASLAALLPFF